MLYALCGLLMYPRVTLNAQGLLCSGGDQQGEVSEFCAGEEAFKSAVSVFALVTVILTVLVSGWLTLGFVRELRASHNARRRILSHLSLDSPSCGPSSPHAKQSWGSARKLGSSSSRKLLGAKRLKSAQSDASWGTLEEAEPEPDVELAGLDSMLHGPTLLRWAQHTADDSVMGSSVLLQSSPEAYVAVEEDLSQIQVDLSQYSSSTTAMVLRHLVELPGLIDYLMWISTEEATALVGFIERLSTFLADQPGVHPVHGLVVFEHRATIGFWLTHTSFEGRATFRQLVGAIAHASGSTSHHQPAWFKPEFPTETESPLGSPLGSAESGPPGRDDVQRERRNRNTNIYARSTSALWAKMPRDLDAARLKEKSRSLALPSAATEASLQFTSERPVVSASGVTPTFLEEPAAPAAGIEWPHEKASQLERHEEESKLGDSVPMSGAGAVATRPFSSSPAAVAQSSFPIPVLVTLTPSDAPPAPASVLRVPSGPLNGNTARLPLPQDSKLTNVKQEPSDVTQVEESEA